LHKIILAKEENFGRENLSLKLLIYQTRQIIDKFLNAAHHLINSDSEQ